MQYCKYSEDVECRTKTEMYTGNVLLLNAGVLVQTSGETGVIDTIHLISCFNEVSIVN